MRGIGDCVIDGLEALTLTPAVRIDLARRHDPSAPAIVVTPYAGRNSQLAVYAWHRLQVVCIHQELATAESLCTQIYAALTAAYGEMDGKQAIWALDEWESRQTTVSPPIYAGSIDPEKSHPRFDKYSLTLELFARQVEVTPAPVGAL